MIRGVTGLECRVPEVAEGLRGVAGTGAAGSGGCGATGAALTGAQY